MILALLILSAMAIVVTVTSLPLKTAMLSTKSEATLPQPLQGTRPGGVESNYQGIVSRPGNTGSIITYSDSIFRSERETR
ncbi:uncharacterized protein N7483_002542 [Penicillium malachiteum]|uniref:uncharacterized protein n=1 Tax=Penicillium malachiteum TaxID=1324776 RepID=UPI002547DFE5|nr:uncharacterized protein N7483_002410 [Penicillium malachiteum]XP_056952128.1 uncharacterized protein N7483_002542 [Penicillium malachiteum]KAJ5737285.1 hypothetical protein N7483_002410 [Penicillium malachiteum]KAJ5737417.1 hypothetical protein N7483_002542 [Penicillium malachiteum]